MKMIGNTRTNSKENGQGFTGTAFRSRVFWNTKTNTVRTSRPLRARVACTERINFNFTFTFLSFDTRSKEQQTNKQQARNSKLHGIDGYSFRNQTNTKPVTAGQKLREKNPSKVEFWC
jgi:hypothetical protein